MPSNDLTEQLSIMRQDLDDVKELFGTFKQNCEAIKQDLAEARQERIAAKQERETAKNECAEAQANLLKKMEELIVTTALVAREGTRPVM